MILNKVLFPLFIWVGIAAILVYFVWVPLHLTFSGRTLYNNTVTSVVHHSFHGNMENRKFANNSFVFPLIRFIMGALVSKWRESSLDCWCDRNMVLDNGQKPAIETADYAVNWSNLSVPFRINCTWFNVDCVS